MTTTQRDETLERLAARLEALEQANARLQQRAATLEAERARHTQAAVQAHAAPPEETSNRTSRRKMLRSALGTAPATVGVGALLEADTRTAPATGAEGQTTFTSTTSSPTVTATNKGSGSAIVATSKGTTLAATSSSTGSSSYGVYGSSSGGTGVYGQTTSGSAGVQGVNASTMSSGYGVSGTHSGSGWGVYGLSASGVGVYGLSPSGYGVEGNSTSGAGVHAQSTSGVGIEGIASMGYGGYFQGGTAQLLLAPASTTGAPTSGGHQIGEIFVDAHGTAYMCTNAGTPGTWLSLSNLAYDVKAFGAIGDSTHDDGPAINAAMAAAAASGLGVVYFPQAPTCVRRP